MESLGLLLYICGYAVGRCARQFLFTIFIVIIIACSIIIAEMDYLACPFDYDIAQHFIHVRGPYQKFLGHSLVAISHRVIARANKPRTYPIYRLSFAYFRECSIAGAPHQPLKVLSTIIFAWQSGIFSKMYEMAKAVWDSVITEAYHHLKTVSLMDIVDDVLDILDANGTVELPGDILCNLQMWDELVGDCTLTCPPYHKACARESLVASVIPRATPAIAV